MSGSARGGTGLFTKGLSFIGKHPVGVGMGAAAFTAFVAEDLGMMAMDFYDTQEAYYRRKKSHSGFHLTQSSSRFIQDQLQSMRRAGNEAEIMHNLIDNYSDIPYDVIPTTKRSVFSSRRPETCGCMR